MTMEEEIVFKLIENDCRENGGSVTEWKMRKMVQLLNISVERYEKIKDKLLEAGTIQKKSKMLRIA